MPTSFCPFSGCGHKATYEAVKPTKCPRCQQAYADAFRVASVVAAHTARAPEVDERPIARASRPKPRTLRSDVSRIMNAPPELLEAAEDDGDFEEDDAGVDPREAKRQARQLAAAFVPIIKGQDEDRRDTVFSFKDMWDAGAATREATAKVKSKRKARR